MTDEMVGIAIATQAGLRHWRCRSGARSGRRRAACEVARSAPALSANIVGVSRAWTGRVSLFIAPELEQVRASHVTGVEQIELHTGEYAHDAGFDRARARLRAASELRHLLGVEVAAGHGLTTANVPAPSWRFRRSWSSTSATPLSRTRSSSASAARFAGNALQADRKSGRPMIRRPWDRRVLDRPHAEGARAAWRSLLRRRCASVHAGSGAHGTSRAVTGQRDAVPSRVASRVSEAFAKCFDGARGVGWHEVQVCRSPSGRPTLEPPGTAVTKMAEFGARRARHHVTIGTTPALSGRGRRARRQPAGGAS